MSMDTTIPATVKTTVKTTGRQTTIEQQFVYYSSFLCPYDYVFSQKIAKITKKRIYVYRDEEAIEQGAFILDRQEMERCGYADGVDGGRYHLSAEACSQQQKGMMKGRNSFGPKVIDTISEIGC